MAALASLDKRLLYSIFGAIFLVTVFGLYVVFRPNKADDVSTPVAPPAPMTYASTPMPKPVQIAPKPVAVTTAPVTPVVVQVPRPAWATFKPVPLASKPDAINDKMVEETIQNGANFLKGQFKNGVLIDANANGESPAGCDALAIYALLHSSQAIEDPDLNSSGPFIKDILDHVKPFPLEKDKPIYGRSLRTAALAFLDREQDRDALAKDRQWLLKAEVNGAYGYEMPPPKAKPEDVNTDNSTSQFGVLGVWAAATAGQPVPDKYWADVEKHWIKSQERDGGWSYAGSGSTAAMTCAGIASLCVSAEYQEVAAVKGKGSGARPAFSTAVNKGLDFLSKEDVILNLGAHPGYSLYAVERAALATGLRYFGKHDWYRELGAKVIHDQLPAGGWSGTDGNDVETGFTLLFLARGRQPLLMDKLRFAGDWDNRPRDVSKLTTFASGQLEKPFAWGVTDLNRDWWDWLESSVLFISTDTPPTFSDEDCDKLRSYTEAGGLIFLHNEFGSKEVDAFADDLSRRLFPAFRLTAMGADNLLYNAVFPVKTKPAMKSVSNGTRTLLIYSPTDITKDWVKYRPRDHDNPNLQIGLNLFVDGAGKSGFRNRLNTPYIGPIEDTPAASIPICQISYPGPWNPEPGVWLRFPRWFQKQTSLGLDVRHTDIKAIHYQDTPIAMLTGNVDCDFTDVDTHALQEYVSKGGVLFVDSTGGSKSFAKAVREGLLGTAFPGTRFTGIPGGHPILAGILPGSDPLPKPHVRTYTASLLNGAIPGVQYARFGKGTIILSDLDITTGLLDSSTYGIYGYTPEYCQSLVKNAILWAASQYHE